MAIGKVIKGDMVPEPAQPGAARSPRPGVMSAEDFEALQFGNRIVDDAKLKAEEIVAAAQQERQKVLEEARELGRQEGLAQCAEQLVRAKMQAGQVLASESSERELVELACRIAEKVVGQELERQPELIASICAQAVEQVRNARAVTLRVNPEDGRVLRAVSPRLMELIARTVDISVKDDPEVERGGCIVQTEFGIVDAQLRTQFEMIRQVVLSDPPPKEGPA